MINERINNMNTLLMWLLKVKYGKGVRKMIYTVYATLIIDGYMTLEDIKSESIRQKVQEVLNRLL